MNATDTKTYRGRTLEEVLPKIKAELGPDAEIIRQRSGLTGGVGGFFQRACVEVEARGPAESAQPADAGSARKGRRFDAYDDQDRKSTRLNSSHANISYAVFCLKKKKNLF